MTDTAEPAKPPTAPMTAHNAPLRTPANGDTVAANFQYVAVMELLS